MWGWVYLDKGREGWWVEFSDGYVYIKCIRVVCV